MEDKIDGFLKVCYYGEAYGKANRGELDKQRLCSPIQLLLTYEEVKFMVAYVLGGLNKDKNYEETK